jgi:hypothetical protein
MKMLYSKKDILTIDKNDGYIAHCISGDFSLGAGLAKKINQKYDMVEKLKKKYTFDGHYEALLIENVFNLITKSNFTQAATYPHLREALVNMRDTMEVFGINYVYVPKLGCGKDKLDWAIVEDMIKEVFKDTDITVEVCVK